MKREYDFSKARRGPLIPKDPGKTQVTIRLDNDVVEYLESIIDQAGGGSFDNLINDALRERISSHKREVRESNAYFRKRAARADIPAALKILERAGVGNSARPDGRIDERPLRKSRLKRAGRRAARQK